MPENKVWEFNKGEWSEAYVFLRLLSCGRIYGATDDQQKNLSVYIDIMNILKFDKGKEFKYVRKGEGNIILIEASCNGDVFVVKTAPELEDKATTLYFSIKNAKPTNKKKTFTVSQLQGFLEELGFSSPKVPSIPKEYQSRFGKKADIIVTMRDSVDNSISEEGFSIKSRLGSNPTLFNAAPASGLVYEVEGCTEEIMHRVNILDKFSEFMIPAMRDEYHLNLRFVGTQPVKGVEIFKRNVRYVESTMADILSWIMLLQCGYIQQTGSMSRELTTALAEINPFDVDDPENYYMAKLKDFHFASFSGMTATERWDGKRRLSGGYIDVNKDGELLYYRAVSDDVFCTYLYEHLYFDRPDRGYKKDIAIAKAKAYFEGRELTEEEIKELTYTRKDTGELERRAVKCDWGYIYPLNGKFYININFQTRFR